MALSITDDATVEEDASKSTGKKVLGDTAQSPNAHLSRQVSNDGLVSMSDTDNGKDYCSSSSGRTSPVRCVSEFDKAVSCRNNTSQQNERPVPRSSNPVHYPKFLEVHKRALRLEAELQPMRLILSRIMAHSTLNRKGIFNSPVDPVALGLTDYHDVIKKPMDLGTVKVKLHAIVYLSRRQVADDIRLVFDNAMTYNPPHNAVHVAARDLLAFFEDQVLAFAPDLCLVKGDHPSPQTAVHATCATESSEAALPPPHSSDVHTQATRNSASGELLEPVHLPRKRAKRGSKINLGHACNRCHGHFCLICNQGCLPLESTLLICNGAHCAGTRIRKGGVYFVSADGCRHFCQRCHAGLPAILPHSGHDDQVRYKRDLLKRKNDEEVVEEWLTCSQCDGAVHRMCALVDEFVHRQEDYRCPDCMTACDSPVVDDSSLPNESVDELYTFVSGSEAPVKLSEVIGTAEPSWFSAEALPETEVSSFIQRRVREQMVCELHPLAERTVLVRIISDCHRCFKVPEVVRNHFRMATSVKDESDSIAPPLAVNYQSKAIALFQKIDGLDVCIFCMYVHEYDGDDHFDVTDGVSKSNQKKRVYIAYLDSVEHFRPRSRRTSVYHEMLVAYLATARKRGFEVAHIWSCPPSRGNCFVFWNHPSSQRTPNPERLGAWYHAALSRAVDCGVVTDIQSLYETSFQHLIEPDDASVRRSFVPCPPLLDGDFWIEEALRLHSINMARLLKEKVEENETPLVLPGFGGNVERCPARQVASLLRDKVISHPSALPFRRPVNAVAMKLVDYHKIIAKPMDLGTVYSRCMLGEYVSLAELVADVKLVFSNAQTYNPRGHVVYDKADEACGIFFSQLNHLVRSWVGGGDDMTWEAVCNTSMSLDLVFAQPQAGADVTESFGPSHLTQLQFDESLIETVSESGCNKENLTTILSSVGKSEPSVLVCGGPEAVQQRMVGDDTWLLDKNQAGSKGAVASKRGTVRRRKCLADDNEDEPPSKRRRQSWLGIEVGTAVRRMRTSFFSCSLAAEAPRNNEERPATELFESYTNDLNCNACEPATCTSSIADVRHSLLEFSQFRNLEFDTLRHAKYSTAILLHHFHNDGAAGAVPICTSCGQHIKEVRWHKLCKVIDLRRRRNTSVAPSFKSEELCSECYNANHRQDNQFIPLQVTVTSHALTSSAQLSTVLEADSE